jgi:hypothetical protein
MNRRSTVSILGKEEEQLQQQRMTTDKQLKRLGGWRSDSMPAKYDDLSIPSRILLSELLHKKSHS